jgi:RNA polymerase sigma-B factor
MLQRTSKRYLGNEECTMGTTQPAVEESIDLVLPRIPDVDEQIERFRECRRTGDPQTRQDLVCHYLPLAQRIARRYFRTGVPLDDLTQIGAIGLMNAVDSFDPERGVKFEAYAYHHIAGEIRHYLRDSAQQVRTPRWVRKSYGELTSAAANLRQILGRTPTRAEIAAGMNLSEASVLDILWAYNRARVHSLNDLTEGQEVRSEVAVNQQDLSLPLPVEDRLVLLEAMGCLTDLQRKVVYYLFYEDLTQNEVARRLGISQRHVSRVLTAALKRLSTFLRAAENDGPAEPKLREAREPGGVSKRQPGDGRGRPRTGPPGWFATESASTLRRGRRLAGAETASIPARMAWDSEPCLAAAGG